MNPRSISNSPLRLLALLVGLTLLVACKRTAEPEPEREARTPAPAVEPADDDETDEASANAAPEAPVAPVRELTPTSRRSEVAENRALASRLGLAPPEPLLIADLLTRTDVRELTDFQGVLLETSLEGIRPSENYNSLRLQADGGYGFGLQVWQFDDVRQQTSHFRRLRETYFDARDDGSGVGNEAFVASFMGIYHHAFLHRSSKSIVVVSCAEEVCDGLKLHAIAQRVASRL